MSDEQLERSILERKASDELRAIATAMSLEPVARTRKADLVNQILRAAGVEVEDASGTQADAELRAGIAGQRRCSRSPTDEARWRGHKAGARTNLPGAVERQVGRRGRRGTKRQQRQLGHRWPRRCRP